MIELRSASLKALVSPLGAALAGLWSTSHPHSLVLGTSDPTAQEEHLAYFGTLVGPVANRIGAGAVAIDGDVWRLECNEGNNTLHSGSQGLHAMLWDMAEKEERRAVFSVNLAHGFGDLPGNRHIRAEYTLEDTKLRLEITAASDRQTVMNIAHHPYWNLDGADTIANHHLRIPAETYLPTNDASLPTGDICAVKGTDYDFRETRKVPTSVKLDANFCLGLKRLEQPRKCAELSVGNRPRLEVHSTEPGLQLYNGIGLDDLPVPFFDERKLTPCAGVALEPQSWPDAPNHPQFPSIQLHASAKYRQITEYRIYT